MEPERFGLVGVLAADRPLLTSVVIAFGITALVVLGLNDSAAVSGEVGYALIIASLLIIAAPVFLTALAPTGFYRQVIYLAVLAVLLIVVAIGFRRSPLLSSIAPFEMAPALVCVFAFSAFLVLMAPVFGSAIRQYGVGVLAAVLGSAGGWAIASMEFVGAPELKASMITVGTGLGVILSIYLAGETAEIFSRGGDNRTAAGLASQETAALALFSVAIAIAAFLALALFDGLDGGVKLHILAFVAAACSILPGAAVLLIGGGAFALRTTSETVAVDENQRRQEMRRAWRPFRLLLPPSSAIAVIAIAGVLAVVAAFEISTPISVSELAFIGFSGLVAAVIFVSIRSAVFIMFLQLVSVLIVVWVGDIFNVQAPGVLERITGLALATGLLAQTALSWRDARSPRRKAVEATEAAMVDSAFRYCGGVVMTTAVFVAIYVSGLWPPAAQAAAYFVVVAIVGFLLSPALMTALGGLLGRD